MRPALVSIIILFANIAHADLPTVLEGVVTHVRDGDTIEVGRIPIRLNGISAPEMHEPLGPTSKDFMVNLVLGQRVRCELNGEKTYDRWVGICYRDGQDIGQAVIKAGLALDCPRFSNGRYAKYEVRETVTQIKLPEYCL